MSLPQQQGSQLRNPISPEPVLNPSQSQRPPRRPTLIKNSGSQTPATLHDKTRVDRIPPLPSQSDVPPNLTDVMLRPMIGNQIHPSQILIDLPIRQMSQHHHPRRNDPQRKPSPLEQNMAPNRKGPILPDQTDGLFPPPSREERTLPRRERKPPHHRQRGLRDVITPRSGNPEEVELRPQNPAVGVTLHQPDPLQRSQQPMHGGPRQPGFPGHSGRRSPTRLVRRNSPQRRMSPPDEINRCVHSPDTTPSKPTTRRTLPSSRAFTG